MSGAKSPLVRVGDFLFKWRNLVFPMVILTAFCAFPPATRLFGSEIADRWRDAAALVIIAAGLLVRFSTIGWAYIKRGGKQKKVYADTLVTTGYFNLSRNPLYVGNLLIYWGSFLFHGHPVVVLGGIALFWFIYTAIVAAEEHFLRDKFGPDYNAYCARVPRWLPVLSRHAEATAGMRFNLARAVVKDYTTITSAALSVLLVLLLAAWQRGSGLEHEAGVALAIGGPVLIFAALAKRYKLRHGNEG